MNQTSLIRIDLSAVGHNMRIIRRIVGPRCVVCPIVKADGYGLGATQMGKHLVAAGAGMLAVYTPGPAAALGKAGVSGPILVLMPVRPGASGLNGAYRLLADGRLHLTVHDHDHLTDLLQVAERFATLIPVHVEVDTGMCRGGCNVQDAPQIVHRVCRSRWLHLAGLFTHFARARTDADFTDKQMEMFEAVVSECTPTLPLDCLIHAANTFATLRDQRYHKSMVRVGLAWAGYGSQWMSTGQFRRLGEQLRPVLTWTAPIVHMKTIEPGTAVGYGSVWTARRRSRIGVIPVGYADGYPTRLGSTDADPKPVCIGVDVGRSSGGGGPRRFARVVGQVNMDQITIDLTDVALADGDDSDQVPVGTTVELIGRDHAAPNHLPALAEAAGMIPHELLSRLNPRIRRVYRAAVASPLVPAGSAVGGS